MATTRHEVIDELLITRRHAQRLAISLRFQGRDKEADQAEEKGAKLAVQIDRLLATAIEAWKREAVVLTTRLHDINRKLSASVEQVRKSDKNVAHIAGALSQIDNAIEVAGRLAG
jgi:hypothetical protein